MQPLWFYAGCMAQFTIRISDELRDRIRAAAARDKRSVNGEIEWLLEAELDRQDSAGAGRAFREWRDRAERATGDRP
jgi:hypothetical protein